LEDLNDYILRRVDAVATSKPDKGVEREAKVGAPTEPNALGRLLEYMPNAALDKVKRQAVEDSTSAEELRHAAGYNADDLPSKDFLARIASSNIDDLETRQANIQFLARVLARDSSARRDFYREYLHLSNWTSALFTELPSLAAELRTKSSEIFQEYDRLSTEAQFRVMLSYPLTSLALAFLIQGVQRNWQLLRQQWEHLDLELLLQIRSPGLLVIGLGIMIGARIINRSGREAEIACSRLLIAGIDASTLTPSVFARPSTVEELIRCLSPVPIRREPIQKLLKPL
jgi:hypothetical protein